MAIFRRYASTQVIEPQVTIYVAPEGDDGASTTNVSMEPASIVMTGHTNGKTWRTHGVALRSSWTRLPSARKAGHFPEAQWFHLCTEEALMSTNTVFTTW